MTARKPFLLRVESGLLAALEQWASDDLRSVNSQIEYLLRDALRRAGRKLKPPEEAGEAGEVTAAGAPAADPAGPSTTAAENATGRPKAPRGPNRSS